MYRVVPLSLMLTHFVGFPAAGELLSVPTNAPAPLAKVELDAINDVVLSVKAAVMLPPVMDTFSRFWDAIVPNSARGVNSS